MSTRFPEVSPSSTGPHRPVALVDVLDEALGTGVTVSGDILLSVADVDLVIISLRALLSSVQGLLGSGSGEDPWGSPDGSPGGSPGGGAGGSHGGSRGSDRAPSRASGPPSPARPSAAGGRPGGRSRRNLLRHREPAAALFAPPTAVRVEPDAERLERGLARLVLTIVELLRELMERQALRRVEGNTLTAEQTERLGMTFKRLRSAMEDLKEKLGLEGEELNLDLGPLGRLL